MIIAFSPEYIHTLPEGHRFPMEKYQLLPEQLLYEGTAEKKDFYEPALLEEDVLLWTHEEAYWHKLKFGTLSKQEIRRIGFPYSTQLIRRELIIARGTIDNALYALENKIAFNIAGGTHHAHTNQGSGFCLLNDIAISANYLLNKQMVERILIIDLDVHQGDGTAQIFREDDKVFTFSMHGENNFPLRKEHSDLDIPLADGTTDKEYLEILQLHLPSVIKAHQPDFVFYLSGVDVMETDRLGRLSLTKEGCFERDKLVLENCRSLELPVAISMGGGYSSRIADIVEAHANTFRLGRKIFS